MNTVTQCVTTYCDNCDKVVDGASVWGKTGYLAPIEVSFSGKIEWYFCSRKCLNDFIGEQLGATQNLGKINPE